VDLVRSLGADHVIDYTTDDVTAGTAGRPERYDVIVQVAGTHRAGRLRRLLTPEGRLVQISGDSPNRWIGPLGRILAGRLLGAFADQAVTSFTVRPSRDDLELLASLVDEGAVQTNIDRTYVLGDVADALEHVETGRARGKVVIAVSPRDP
jgi:NADPH:quinone reductase-like Zn-dependent oxidoreductase